MMRWKNSSVQQATWDIGTDAEGRTLALINKDVRSTAHRAWTARVIVERAQVDVPDGPFTRDEAQRAAEDEWRRRAERRHPASFGRG